MIGWIGALGFAFCGLPQALRCWRDGHAEGLSMGFLLLWTQGEVFTFAAVLMDAPVPYLIFNYALNAVFLAVMWKFKLWPRPAPPVPPIARPQALQVVHGGKS